MHDARQQFLRERRDARFIREFFSRGSPFTYSFLFLNVFIFALMVFAGGSENRSVLIAFGAKLGVLIDQRQYWRFVTPIFIHVGIIHLLVNSYALYVLGPQVEKLYGSARFSFLYVMSGMAGVLGSYFYSSKEIPSAGASGALFGLIGVLTVFGLKYRKELPGVFRRSFGFGMLPVILINLIIGFTIRGIDNAAHLGGMAAGMLLAFAVPYHPPGTKKTGIVWRLAQLMSLALIPVSFAFAARMYDGPALSWEGAQEALFENQNERVQHYVDAINDGRRSFLEGVAKGEYSSLDASIEALESAPKLDPHADAFTARLASLLKKLKAAHAQEAVAGTLGPRPQLMREFRDFSRDFSAWTESEGRVKYGIRFSAPENGSPDQ